MDDKDFCFKHQKLQNVSDSNCNISTNNHDVWCSSLKKNVLYGTVRVKLNFTLHRNTIDEGIFQGYHSSFTGADIGAQIKGKLIKYFFVYKNLKMYFHNTPRILLL